MKWRGGVLSLLLAWLPFASSEEVSPDIRPQTETNDQLDQQQILLQKESAPEKVPDPTPIGPWAFHNRSLLGSNFTYGNNSSFDVDLKTQTSLVYKQSRLENVLQYYTYYLNPDVGPTERYKTRFNGALKYLYEIYPRWSPFVAAKLEQTFERVNGRKNYTEKDSYDLGLRYDYHFEKSFYFMAELSHRYIVENAPNLTHDYHNLRGYLAAYYYARPFGFGFWIEAIAPYHEPEDYWINFGPDLSYTFPGTSFFIGITANASIQGLEKYPGDSRFDIWSGSFYTGIKF